MAALDSRIEYTNSMTFGCFYIPQKNHEKPSQGEGNRRTHIGVGGNAVKARLDGGHNGDDLREGELLSDAMVGNEELRNRHARVREEQLPLALHDHDMSTGTTCIGHSEGYLDTNEVLELRLVFVRLGTRGEVAHNLLGRTTKPIEVSLEELAHRHVGIEGELRST